MGNRPSRKTLFDHLRNTALGNKKAVFVTAFFVQKEGGPNIGGYLGRDFF